MKVAISIPDPLFAEAELLAKRWKMSRSKVYARALDQFLTVHGEDEITNLANKAADDLAEKDQAVLKIAAQTVLNNTEW